MVFTVIIIVLIAAYVAWVIYRQVKRYKAGKFCDCGCENCPSKTRNCKYK